MMEQIHVTDLLPAYALDALEPDELQIVKKHLETCDICRVELQSFYETASILSALPAQINPPRQLKSSIMSQIQPASRGKVERPARAKPSWFNWLTRPTPVWAIAAFVLLVGIILSNYFLWQSLNQANQRAKQTQQQLSAMVRTSGNFRVIPLAATDMSQAGAVLVITHDGASGTLVVNGLPELDPKHQYQLWLVKNGKRASGGVFSMASDGYTLLEINNAPMSLLTYTTFGVTIEPFGGSPGPTGKKVLGGNS